jgi:hypothetical protein
MKQFKAYSLLSALATLCLCNAQPPVPEGGKTNETSTTSPDHHGTDGSIQAMIKVLPFFILAMFFLCYSCKRRQEEVPQDTTARSREERRAHLESLLIVEKVTKLPPTKQSPASVLNKRKSSLLEMAEEGAAATDCRDCDKGVALNSSVSVPFGEESIVRKTEENTTDGEMIMQRPRSMNSKLSKHVPTSREDDTTLLKCAKGGDTSDLERLAPPHSGESHEKDRQDVFNCIDVDRQPSFCDICLGDYEVGNEICWSPNKECIHHFHKDCCLDWLMKSTKCPECRREYVPNDCSKI